MTNEELALKIQAGEQGYISTLWESNTGLFAIKANGLYTAHYDRCQASGVTFDDVFQVCYFALLDAVQAYDPQRGYKFTSYLTYPLKNHFNALVGLRTSKRDPLNDAARLDNPVGEEGNTTLLELVPDSNRPIEAALENVYTQELRRVLKTTLETLPAEQSEVVRRRHFHGQTLQMVADAMSISVNRIRQLEKSALRILRRERRLMDYHNEVRDRAAYHHRGYKTFNTTWTTSTEHAVLLAEWLTYRARTGLED